MWANIYTGKASHPSGKLGAFCWGRFLFALHRGRCFWGHCWAPSSASPTQQHISSSTRASLRYVCSLWPSWYCSPWLLRLKSYLTLLLLAVGPSLLAERLLCLPMWTPGPPPSIGTAGLSPAVLLSLPLKLPLTPKTEHMPSMSLSYSLIFLNTSTCLSKSALWFFK